MDSAFDRRKSMDSANDRRPSTFVDRSPPSVNNLTASSSTTIPTNMPTFSAFPPPTLSPLNLWNHTVSTSSAQSMHSHSHSHSHSEPVTHLTPISGTGNMSSPNVHIPGPVGMMLPPSAAAAGTPFSVASSSSSGFIDPSRLSVGPSTGMNLNLHTGE